MSVSPISSGASLPKSDSFTKNIKLTAEEAASFESSLEQASTASQDPSQNSSDACFPAASWDVFWKGYNHSIFDHSRREFTYYDQHRKEIDYGNKA